MSALRKKRLWTAADFAEFLGGGITPRAARELLKRWDAESGGKLLIPTTGTNRLFRFAPAMLLKLHPEIFDRVESLEGRVEELEEQLGDVKARQKRIVAQVGQNTRDIAKHSAQLQLFRRAS